MTEIQSHNDKKLSLEREVSDLRSKLLFAENEISQLEASEKVSKSLAAELQRVRDEINKVSREREDLLETVSSLHQRMREVDNTGGLTRLTAQQEQVRDMIESEEERMAKNREAYLNVMLLKAKQEKLKAIKIIVNLLGKETVQGLLKSSASPVTSPSVPMKSVSMSMSSPSAAVARERKSLSSSSPNLNNNNSNNNNNLFSSPSKPSNNNSTAARYRSPTRTNSMYAEELMNADNNLPTSNTTIGNDLVDRLITALSSPRSKSRTKSRYSLK